MLLEAKKESKTSIQLIKSLKITLLVLANWFPITARQQTSTFRVTNSSIRHPKNTFNSQLFKMFKVMSSIKFCLNSNEFLFSASKFYEKLNFTNFGNV